jgi:glycosyltransferase involved in cell wall biosynthesis
VAVRILVLAPTFLPVVGGAEMVLFEVYRRLARRHDVLLLTPVRPPALLAEQGSAEYEGLTPFPVERYADRVSFLAIPGHRLTAGAIPPFSLSAVGAIRRAVRQFRPDVANVHYLMPTGLAALAAERWLGVPTVATMNGRDVPGPGVPRLWRWWQRALLALVSDVTYVSGYCRRAIYGAGGGRGEVIYNGVDMPPPPGDPGPVRRTLDVAADEPLIFALQRLAPEKRADVLLHALRHALDRVGAGTLVIGGTGPEAGRLAALARELGIEKQTRFTGYIPRAALAGYFVAADVFAFHSTFETFGLVVAQAMSYGRPVVTVGNTALPEVVGDAAVLVPTGDARAFGDAIADLIGDADRRRRLGEAGRARATALFDWDRIALQYETVLVRAARGPRRPRPVVAMEARA